PLKIVIIGDCNSASGNFYLQIKKEWLKCIKETRQTDYFASMPPRRMHSLLINETYLRQAQGIKFDNGVFYSNSDLERLLDWGRPVEFAHPVKFPYGVLDILVTDNDYPMMLKCIHLIKKKFEGILY